MDRIRQAQYKESVIAVELEDLEMELNRGIVLSRTDVHRLRAILGARRGSLRDREHLLDLYEELERARILDEDLIGADIVTIDSEVRVVDSVTGVSSKYVLVMPSRANLAAGRLSVLAPLGTALLGYREGDEVAWSMPGGVRRLRIDQVRQPARAASRSEEVAVS